KNFSELISITKALEKKEHQELALSLALQIFKTEYTLLKESYTQKTGIHYSWNSPEREKWEKQSEIRGLFELSASWCTDKLPQDVAKKFINGLMENIITENPTEIPGEILSKVFQMVKQVSTKYPEEAQSIGEQLLKIHLQRPAPIVPIDHYVVTDRLATACRCSECNRIRKFLGSRTEKSAIYTSVYKPEREHIQRQLAPMKDEVTYKEQSTKVTLTKTRTVA